MRRTKVEPFRRKLTSSTTPSSTIGAVLRNAPQKEDDEVYDPTRPTVGNVASVVRVTERKSSVPLELQANKMLLLRAVKDAHQSTNHNRKRTNEEAEYTPTPIKKRLGDKQVVPAEHDLHPEDLRNYLNAAKKGSLLHDSLCSTLSIVVYSAHFLVSQMRARFSTILFVEKRAQSYSFSNNFVLTLCLFLK